MSEPRDVHDSSSGDEPEEGQWLVEKGQPIPVDRLDPDAEDDDGEEFE